MNNIGITKKLAHDFFSGFSKHPALKNLEVSKNPLGDDGVQTLLMVLGTIPSLECLKMARTDCKKAVGGLFWTHLLSKARNFKFLDISGNKMGKAGATNITNLFLNPSSLTHFRASGCNFENGQPLFHSLMHNRNVVWLDLSLNGFTDSTTASSFADYLKVRPNQNFFTLLENRL